MRSLYDQLALSTARKVTRTYSTSFSLAVRMLAPSIRQDIHNIYGFVRLADEIVDSFHGYDKNRMLDDLEKDTWAAIQSGLSINPVIHAFAQTVRTYSIDKEHITAFLTSMRADLEVNNYSTKSAIDAYIYGSADVVGLMCLKVFVHGNQAEYERLKDAAMRLGSAFQKVNFLRDIQQDSIELNRSYFPNVDFNAITAEQKEAIIAEIRDDFAHAFHGLKQLPLSSRSGVYLAYRYYLKLLNMIDRTHSEHLLSTRIRVSNASKLMVLMESRIRLGFQLL